MLFPLDPPVLRTILLSVSVILSILFLPYGLNFYLLMHRAGEYSPPSPPGRRKFPVTIQIPVYNERYVVERIVGACAKVADRYGCELVQLQVLDDSTDETGEIARGVVERYRRDGFDIDYVHRDGRRGFKAGALQDALPRAKHPFIAIFDADFVPPEDFLDRVMPHFADGGLGLVQCRWSHINRDYNFITKAIAIGFDGHHILEQAGRYAANFLINFNGSAGVIRRRALEEAGGWKADTLAEDLDASYRMQLRGWRALYLRDVACAAEVPPSVPAVKKQQARWASGSIRTFRKLLPAIVGDRRLSVGQKAEGLIHLSFYSVHPLMFAAYVLAVTAAVLDIRLIEFDWSTAFTAPARQAGVLPDVSLVEAMIAYAMRFATGMVNAVSFTPQWVLLNVTIFFCAISMWIFYARSLKWQGRDVRSEFKSLGALGLIGFGISLSNTLAVAQGFFGRSAGVFNRTPKYRIESRNDTWQDKKYQVKVDKVVMMELAAGTLGALSIAKAVLSPSPNLGILPILFLYTTAYLYIARISMSQGAH